MPRPKQFDPDDVLERAMQLFWERGYKATSVRDLVDRMGINQFSIYDTFGDKHALFLAALDRYCDVVMSERLHELEHGDAGIETIRSYFGSLAEAAAMPMARWGCMMANATVEIAPHDAATAARAGAQLERLEGAFHRALSRARRNGEIGGKGGTLRGRARHLVMLSQGLFVMAKAGQDPKVIQGAVKAALFGLASF